MSGRRLGIRPPRRCALRRLVSRTLRGQRRNLGRGHPRGSCVISDEGELSQSTANRSRRANRVCPPMVDWYGTWLQDDRADLPPTNTYTASLITTWITWLNQADYIVLYSHKATPTHGRARRSRSSRAITDSCTPLPARTHMRHRPWKRPAAERSDRSHRRASAAENRQDYATSIADYDQSLALSPLQRARAVRSPVPPKRTSATSRARSRSIGKGWRSRPTTKPAEANLNGREPGNSFASRRAEKMVGMKVYEALARAFQAEGTSAVFGIWVTRTSTGSARSRDRCHDL